MCSRTMRSKMDAISDNFYHNRLSARMRHLCHDGGITMAHRRAPRTPSTASLPIRSTLPTAGLTDSRHFGSFTISPLWLISGVSTEAPVGLCSNAASPLGHLPWPTIPHRSAPAVGASIDVAEQAIFASYCYCPLSCCITVSCHDGTSPACAAPHSPTPPYGTPTPPHTRGTLIFAPRYGHRRLCFRCRVGSSQAASPPPGTARWQPQPCLGGHPLSDSTPWDPHSTPHYRYIDLRP